ncbi:hypothetical protein FOA52_008048 [Chlamydomonas sp. UWO 241]|nr:hypothetical protein FOA52_008048 [Chlamydomonas sp. UWO 241]
MLHHRDRELGMLYMGARERARAALHKMMMGQPVHIGFVGGSVTEGVGSVFPWQSWPNRLVSQLVQVFANDNITFFNAAKGATNSNFAATCTHDIVKNDTDLVFVEYSINDAVRVVSGEEKQQLLQRKSFEVLIRRLLTMPSRPAVVVFSACRWGDPVTADPEYQGNFLLNAETDFLEWGLYYHTSALSCRAAAFQQMLAGAPGFKTDNCVGRERASFIDVPDDVFFLGDCTHPYGPTGHN